LRKGFMRKIKPLEILTKEQVEAIHRGTLDILERTGVRFEDDRALKFLEDSGCHVDYKERRVRFPSHLVEESIRRCPSSFYVKARDPEDDMRIGGNTLYFMSFAGLRICDPYTGETRAPTLAENDEAVRISDALENLDCFPSYTPYFEIEGVEPPMLCPISTASRIRNSTKISRSAQIADAPIWDIKMAEVVGMQMLGNMEASPPLTYYEDATKAAFKFGEVGFPVYIASGGVMGGSAPATIVGSTISNNAEMLAAVVMLQLIRPGIGIVANDFVFPMNMRNGSPHFGSLGCSLHQMIFNQIWHGYYGIPTVNAAAGASNSKLVDYQNGYEKMFVALTAALSGANIIALHGGVTAELSYHPIQAILDDDIACLVGRTIEGVEVTPETMAIEVINEVGPIPGHFLDKEHTRRWWKKEHFMPKAADMLSYPEWLRKGRKKALEYAKDRMEEILKTHKPKPLSEDENREIDEILREAREYYKEREML
jgi:trimethylamine--corrinoid protein Co-methyltransferase